MLAPYLLKHNTTNISDTDYTIIGLGMMDVVNHGTGRVAQMPGVEICAKTGTVENKAVINGQAVKMQNHSMFVAFAPRVNPKIAIAVTVENAGYGATWAGPVASLMIEKYLTDTIAPKRKYLEEKMYNGNVIGRHVYYLDSMRRLKDVTRDALRTERQQQEQQRIYSRDSTFIMRDLILHHKPAHKELTPWRSN